MMNKTHRLLRAAAIALVIVLSAVACGDDADSADTGPELPAAALEAPA